MTLEESIASMSPQLIAESLEIMTRVNRDWKYDFSPGEISALNHVAGAIRGDTTADPEAINYIVRIFKYLDGQTPWRSRQLVLQKAVNLTNPRTNPVC